MIKPTQDELDKAIEVLEYRVADLRANEPYAVTSIDEIEAILSSMPRDEGELGDI